jgi:hypothetical protein
MEIDFAPSHNPTLFGSLSVSPPVSMFDAFSPLLHFNDEFLDALHPSKDDDDDDDWLKPLLFDQFFEHELQQNLFSVNDLEVKHEEEKTRSDNYSSFLPEKSISSSHLPHIHRGNEFLDFYHQQSSEQQLPSTTTTVHLIHQPKIEPAELPTTLYVTGNELQFHPILTANTNSNTHGKTIGHTFTSKEARVVSLGLLLTMALVVFLATTSSPLPSVPIVPARVLKGKKFKRGGRVTSRA